MPKKFKLSFSNVLPSSLQLCRSKKLPICPQKIRRPVYGLAPVNPKTLDISFPASATSPPSSTPDHRYIRPHDSFKITDFSTEYSSSSDYPSWVKDAIKWSVISRARGDPSKVLDLSFDTSCDMSPFHGEIKKKNKDIIEFPVKASVFKRIMPCAMDGKVRESIAVVKKSNDPLEDFKRSMLEMILEKQMSDANDLEQLLECFLTLNSARYHEVIMDAFTEIWESLFADSS
ncbi:hypothetical protein ACFE04_028578 [Oxalis oulophora]